MSLIASVKDGVIQDTTASANSNSKIVKNKSSLDKESFLQLLVAQMKYQDPLEPTSNTEYVAQLATFSELEEMQNLSSNMSVERASNLVGKNVIMKTISSVTGDTYYTPGKVDYMVVEGGKAYLSIDESLYSIDDLDTIVDDEYLAKIEAEKNAEKNTEQSVDENTEEIAEE